MTRSDSATPCEQATLEEFTDPNRCTAIAVHTDERCRRPVLPGLSVCHSHADAEDLAQLAASLSSGEPAQ